MPNFAIQSGVLKGLKLVFNPAEGTRPTKSIVRESFFNTIGGEIVGSVFIEAFAGCGSMGLEALSRGASEAVFYEIDKGAYSILEKNLSLAKRRIPTLNISHFHTDFFAQDLKPYMSLPIQVILYLDPPFCIREGKADIYQKLLAKIHNLGRCAIGLIVFEHWSEYNMPHIIGVCERLKVRQFGKSALTYFRLKD